ncbi:MAG: PIN domain-containing protein [Clostridium sp.]|nr:PIN domain-containing protein [Clostridium sp.]
MRILIDTNIMLDVLMGRQPYFDIADRIIKLCAEKKVEGYIAAHSIPNMFYILRKYMSDSERREALKLLCQIVKIEGIDSSKIFLAIENGKFSDLEDCLQEECAVAISADYIVTRNIKDFEFSRVPAILPDIFLQRFEKIEPDL